MTNTKNCLACERPIIGRADKKFCNDNCRNSYNNLLNSDTVNHVRNINNILRKNRRILEDALRVANKTVVMPKTELIKKGFSFRFYTSSYTNPASQTYFFCYEYGYRQFENDKSKELYLLVRSTLKEFAQETKEELEEKRP